MDTVIVPMSSLILDPSNARRHSETNLKAIETSLSKFGQRKPIVVQGEKVLAGNGTLEAARRLGWAEIAIVRVPDDWDEQTAKAYALADNRSAELAEWDEAVLAEQILELEDAGWDMQPLGFETQIPAEIEPGVPSPKLADRFIIPPFSVFDQRSHDWQERKKSWLSLGLKSEIGREDTLTLGSLSGIVPDYYYQKEKAEAQLGRKLDAAEFESQYLQVSDTAGLSSTGTSVFDPVLCEIAYRWFCPPGGSVLDPFAGGVVRGAIAGALELDYTGIDLRPEQILANESQWAEIRPQLAETRDPRWITGDSQHLDELVGGSQKYDLIFSCPPYADLERYSDSPADLSTMEYEDFLVAYREIISRAVSRLADDAFAVWVVGDVRDKKGNYRGLVLDTIEAFEMSGAHYYNEAILVSPIGSLAVRVGRSFTTTRKLGKTHQTVLVFIKGNAKKATEKCGTVEVTLPVVDSDPSE